MENCKDLDKLFGPRTVRIRKGQQLEAYPIHSTDDYYFKGETLFFQDSPSTIETIYQLTDGEFRLLYQRPDPMPDIQTPDPMPDIQTGDFIRNHRGLIGVVVDGFIYYMDGGFDLLSSVAKLDYYIKEIRRPSKEVHSYGFSGYSGMPIIWDKN